MESRLIQPAGSFQHWDAAYLTELQTGPISEAVGQELVFENNRIRVWQIVLRPGERLPFHRHTRPYNWTCLTAGQAISRYANGQISAFSYQPGDLSFYQHATKGDFVHDLENVGNTVLDFCTVEYT